LGVRKTRRLAAAAVLAGLGLIIVLLVLTGYGGQAQFRAREAVSRGEKATLTDLRHPDALAGAFEAARGHPRLVLFLSPT
jgi:hypothetical protein